MFGFSAFVMPAPNATLDEFMDRWSLKGLPPKEAAQRIAEFCRSKVGFREITCSQRAKSLGIILDFLAKREKDAATADPQTMLELREYFRVLIDQGKYSENTMHHYVKAWNASVRQAFGEQGRPGKSLIMERFRSFPRLIERLDEEELTALASAASRISCRSKVDKDAFETYVELECCGGPRVGSFVYYVNGRIVKEATFQHVDWKKGVIWLHHMKNRREHPVVLSVRALTRLKRREANLRAWGLWKGLDTPILLGRSGQSLTPNTLNRMLRSAARLAGIMKPISTHVLRKSVGTHIGRYNPRYAAEQLGITERTFELHYNQPTLDDRLARRDLLPGHRWEPTTPEEMVGRAWLSRNRGDISETEFQEVVLRADQLRALPSSRVPETSPYQ
jgi:integrase